MLKIRLQRVGRKNDPAFRVVVVDSKRGPKSGDNVEILGSYNPRFNKAQVKSDRVKHWMSVGAQVSDTVHNLLINEKIIEGKKINVLSKKSPIKKAEEEVKEGAPTTEEKKEEAPMEAKEAEVSKEEAKKEEAPAETKTEEADTDTKAEAPVEESKVKEETEEVKEEKPETPKEDIKDKPEAPKEEEPKTEEVKKEE